MLQETNSSWFALVQAKQVTSNHTSLLSSFMRNSIFKWEKVKGQLNWSWWKNLSWLALCKVKALLGWGENTKHSTCTWMSILQKIPVWWDSSCINCMDMLVDVHSSRFQCPTKFETCKCKSCQKKSPSFQLVKIYRFHGIFQRHFKYLHKKPVREHHPTVQPLVVWFSHLQTSEIYLWPRPFSLLEVEQTLQHCEHVAEVYPWTIVASTFIRWISSMFSICWSVFLFFPVVSNAKRVSQNVGFPLEASWALPQIGWSWSPKNISMQYDAIIISPVWSVLSLVIFAPDIYWCMYFWQCFIGTHTTYNFDFKALQATHRSTWCLQEHRN